MRPPPEFDNLEKVATDDGYEVDLPEEAKTHVGDLFQLGRHRLLCGDCTKAENVSRLAKQPVDLLLTDPPYNVALGSHDWPDSARLRHRRADGNIIENDSLDDGQFVEFLRSAFSNAFPVLRAGAGFYAWYSSRQAQNFLSACNAAGLHVRQQLIWNKNSFTLGRQDYQWKHEPCLYGWKDGAAHTWKSDRKQPTVLDFPRPVRSAEHPTMKPIELFDYLMRNSTAPGDIVLDIFAGSGTTMIAAEQDGRTAYCMELDPRYCDVIIDRWEKLTGNKAEKLED